MKKMKLLFAGILMLCSFQTLHAQNAKDDMIKEWERAKIYTKEYLDAMPADKYDLKPTPEMRSFAEQMLHLTDANYGFTTTITGAKSPFGMGEAEKTTDKSKENVSKIVLSGYDFVIENLKSTSEAQLSETIKFMGRFELTKGMAFNKCFEHQTHHRGQTTVYIRLGGAKPPQEKLF
jgi:uncharacterized damage-inducible protein DinB